MITQRLSKIPQHNQDYDFYFISPSEQHIQVNKDTIILCLYNKKSNEASFYQKSTGCLNLKYLFTRRLDKEGVKQYLNSIEEKVFNKMENMSNLIFSQFKG